MVIECFGFTLWTSQTTFIAITSSHSPTPLYKVGRTYTRWGGINTWSLMTSVQDLALLCPAMPLNLLDLIFLIYMIGILTYTVKRVRFSIVEHVCRSLYEDISRLYNLKIFLWNYSWSAGDLMALYKAIATRSTFLLRLIPNQAILQTFIFWLSKTLFWFSLSEGGIFCNLFSIEMVNHMMFYIIFYVKYIHWVLTNAYQINHGYYRRYKVV